jgi:hypothetical protein
MKKVQSSSCTLSINNKKIPVHLDMKALEAFVRGDADNAQKNALNGVFWQVAEGLGLVDDKGNYLEPSERKMD